VIWLILTVLLLFAILLWVAWWRRETGTPSLRDAPFGSEEEASRKLDDRIAKSAGIFSKGATRHCPNCDETLPTIQTEDGFFRCANCESLFVTPGSPYQSPLPLRHRHTVGILQQDKRSAIQINGQIYSRLEDILDPETRRVAGWALQRHFARMDRALKEREMLLFPTDDRFAGDVEKLVRDRLWKDTLLRHKQISLRNAPDGSLLIEVDGQTYTAVDQIPGTRLREIFHESIHDWESRH